MVEASLSPQSIQITGVSEVLDPAAILHPRWKTGKSKLSRSLRGRHDTYSVASGDPGCPEKSWKNKLSASVFTLPGNRQGNSVPQMFPGCDGGPEKATG